MTMTFHPPPKFLKQPQPRTRPSSDLATHTHTHTNDHPPDARPAPSPIPPPPVTRTACRYGAIGAGHTLTNTPCEYPPYLRGLSVQHYRNIYIYYSICVWRVCSQVIYLLGCAFRKRRERSMGFGQGCVFFRLASRP